MVMNASATSTMESIPNEHQNNAVAVIAVIVILTVIAVIVILLVVVMTGILVLRAKMQKSPFAPNITCTSKYELKPTYDGGT